MRLIERYIFGRMAGTFALTFVAVGSAVWLAAALNQFNLVTEKGQGLALFLRVSLFSAPVLVIVVMPVAALIAVVHTMTTLNGDSELAVINATGAPQLATLKPALLIGVITMAVVAAMTLYFAPLSSRLGQSLITSVRSDILTSIIREGQFMTLAKGLTFHMQSRAVDGSLHGIFIADDRDPDHSSIYLAQTGAVLHNPLGVFLIMTNGMIQRRSKIDGSISMIEFSSYAFDLSTLASQGAAPAVPPSQRSTAYLFDPEPDDPYFRRSPRLFRTELHKRLATPLYGLAIALIPLMFIGQAVSPRESRAASVTVAGAIALVLGICLLFLPSMADNFAGAVPVLYALPVGATIISIALVAAGIQLRPPARFGAFGDRLFRKVSWLLRVEAAIPGGD